MANTLGPLTKKHQECSMAKADLTAQYVRQILSYDPETGIFRWAIERRPSRFKPGSIAGGLAAKGHIAIKIDGQSYKAHRLAWLYMTGEWPHQQIDHRNRIPADNRFKNLRECTNPVNCQNQGIRKNNASGFAGVHRFHKKWAASISINMTRIHLGSFDTPEEAAAAYMQAKNRLHISSSAINS